MTEPSSLAAALAAFQADLPRVSKASRGNRGRYADLADVSMKVLPLLAAHGLSWSACPTVTDGGMFVLRYALRHASGESTGGDYPLPAPTEPPQTLGSAVTYAKRYALCAVTGVAPDDDDDDGAHATENHHAQPAPSQRSNGTGAARPVKPDKTELDKRAVAAVDAMLAVSTVDAAEKMISRAFNSPAKDTRADGGLKPDQREVLGLEPGTPYTLHELAHEFLAYVEKHKRSVNDASVPA